MIDTARLIGVVLTVAACQSANTALALSQTGAPAAPDDGPSRVVRLLEDAAEADRQGDAAKMRQAVAALDALGAHPSEPADVEMLARWRGTGAGSAPPMRGRTLGPAFRSGEVAAQDAVEMEQTFLAGQSAVIALRAQGSGPLALKVVDGNERAVCSSTGDAARCRWTPPFTQRHVIRIDNPSRARVRYFISFN